MKKEYGVKMTEYFFSIPLINLINIVGLNLGILIIWITIWHGSNIKHRKIALIVVGFIFILILYLSLISPMQAKVVLAEKLEISIPPYAHEIIPKEEIMRIYVVDLENNQSLQPIKKIIGGEMGDSKEGIFQLRNQKKAIMKTEGSKVICIELNDKYIMVTPDRFDDFVFELEQKFHPVERLI